MTVTAAFVLLGTASSLPILIGMATGLAAYVTASLIDKTRTDSQFIDAAAAALKDRENGGQ